MAAVEHAVRFETTDDVAGDALARMSEDATQATADRLKRAVGSHSLSVFLITTHPKIDSRTYAFQPVPHSATISQTLAERISSRLAVVDAEAVSRLVWHQTGPAEVVGSFDFAADGRSLQMHNERDGRPCKTSTTTYEFLNGNLTIGSQPPVRCRLVEDCLMIGSPGRAMVLARTRPSPATLAAPTTAANVARNGTTDEIRYRRIADGANLKRIGMACRMYDSDHGRRPADLGQLLEAKYLTDGRVFVCPGSMTRPPADAAQLRNGQCDYLYFGKGATPSQTRDVVTPLACTKPGLLGERFVNVLYADGHTNGFDMPPHDIQQLIDSATKQAQRTEPSPSLKHP